MKDLNLKKISSLIIATLFLLVFVLCNQAFAESSGKVYLRALGASEVAPDSDITIGVYVDTGTPINALEFEVMFPKDKLQFIKFDNTGSIVTIWQHPPKIIANGNIKFAGGMFKPYAGNHGLVMRLSFKALYSGISKISFAKSDIYIADGKGTRLSLPTSSIAATPNAPSENTIALNVDPSYPKVSYSKQKEDTTPPNIELTSTNDVVSKSKLIVFNAVDPDSGVAKTEMRYKNWFQFGDWQTVENPVVYPSGLLGNAWQVELSATNNSGAESIKILSEPTTLYRKLFILICISIFLVIILRLIYNRKKRNI